MRAPDPRDPLDRWLRDGLAPPQAQVRRVIGHALQGPGEPEAVRAVGWRLPLAACALLALAWVFVALDRHVGGSDLAPRPGSRAPTALITNVSGEVELVLPGPPLPRRFEPASGTTGVVEVFNHGGCVAAVLPSGRVRYWIIGGDT